MQSCPGCETRVRMGKWLVVEEINFSPRERRGLLSNQEGALKRPQESDRRTGQTGGADITERPSGFREILARPAREWPEDWESSQWDLAGMIWLELGS